MSSSALETFVQENRKFGGGGGGRKGVGVILESYQGYIVKNVRTHLNAPSPPPKDARAIRATLVAEARQAFFGYKIF